MAKSGARPQSGRPEDRYTVLKFLKRSSGFRTLGEIVDALPEIGEAGVREALRRLIDERLVSRALTKVLNTQYSSYGDILKATPPEEEAA